MEVGPEIRAAQTAGSMPAKQSLLGRLHPVVFAIVALAVVFVLYQFVAGAITLLLSKGSITPDNVALIRWSTLLGQIAFILIPTVLLVRARGEQVRRFLKLRVPDIPHLAVGVVAVFALQQMLQGYMVLQDALPMPEAVRRFMEVFKQLFEQTYRLLIAADSPLEFAFVVIVVALVPAICEELLFRGLVQTCFARVTGGMQAAVITGLIFGAYHLNPFSVVPLIVLGSYFGFLVHRSGSVVVAAWAHFVNNFVACAAAYLQLRDDFVMIAPHRMPTPSMQLANVVLASLVFAGATALFVRMTEGKTA